MEGNEDCRSQLLVADELKCKMKIVVVKRFGNW